MKVDWVFHCSDANGSDYKHTRNSTPELRVLDAGLRAHQNLHPRTTSLSCWLGSTFGRPVLHIHVWKHLFDPVVWKFRVLYALVCVSNFLFLYDFMCDSIQPSLWVCVWKFIHSILHPAGFRILHLQNKKENKLHQHWFWTYSFFTGDTMASATK